MRPQKTLPKRHIAAMGLDNDPDWIETPELPRKNMSEKGVAQLIEHFDKDGNLTHIEVIDDKDISMFDIVWDENDPQTADKRKEFRTWARQVIRRYGYTACE
jgi:hypothetical protein